MSQKSLFIVVEGIDGSGKTMQVNLLAEKLKQEGRETEYIHFPQHEESFFGRFIDRYLRGEFGQPQEIDPHFIAHAYIADFFEATPRLKEIQARGKIILGDRYLPSTLAIQSIYVSGEKKTELLKWIEETAFQVYKILKPDLIIIPDITAEKAYELIGNKEKRAYLEGGGRDIHEADLSFLEKMRQNYLDLAKNHAWFVVNNLDVEILRKPEDIHKDVWEIVKTKI